MNENEKKQKRERKTDVGWIRNKWINREGKGENLEESLKKERGNKAFERERE